MSNQRNESPEETVRKIRELQQTIFLPSEPVNRIIDHVLPKDQTIDDETRAACVYTLSIFNVCLGTAAFDEMEKRNQDELQTSHLKAALKQMRFKLPKVQVDVDEHKRELEEEEIFEQSNSETESDLDSSDDDASVDSRDSIGHEISSEDNEEEVEELSSSSVEMADSTNSGESDSGEKMSTTDSRNWSEEDSDSGSESDDEENDDEFSITDTRDEAKMRRKRSSRRKRTHQSDTETRNLLDDIGGEEEFLDLEESKENSKIDVRFFEMSEEQLDYYTKCFLYMQRKTVGQPTISGAVNGADERVVEFFRKSRLDTKTLSKIWSLADVNEDGFLNHAEFVLAMHLIVLHVKGRVPVPSRIPSPVRPCLTPTRLPQYPFGVELQNSTASSTLSSAADNASTSRGSDPTQPNLHFHQHSQPPNLQTVNSRLMPMSTLSADETNHKQQSLSDDHLHVHTKNQRDVVVTDFSDAPPVLVDNRPTALNVSTSSAGFSLLNSLANRGPPPLPPTRNYSTGAAKGHGRSISLDLNTFAAVSGHRALPPHPSSAMFQSTTSGDNKFEASTASAENYQQRVHENDVSAGSVPNVGTSTVFQRQPPSHHHSASISSGTTTAQVHPPLPPQRPTAGAFQSRPTAQHATVQLTSTSTQTEISEFGENDHEDSLQTRGSNRLALLDEHTFAQLMQGAERMAPAERCNVLRRYNAELENERSTLAQICLQLQLRIDEAEAALKEYGIRACVPSTDPASAPIKPTVL